MAGDELLDIPDFLRNPENLAAEKAAQQKENNMHIELGTKAKDKITGFQGIVTGHTRFLTGCDQYLIQPECDSDGKYPDSCWLDENRLELLDAPMLEIDTTKVNGPCGTAPKY